MIDKFIELINNDVFLNKKVNYEILKPFIITDMDEFGYSYDYIYYKAEDTFIDKDFKNSYLFPFYYKIVTDYKTLVDLEANSPHKEKIEILMVSLLKENDVDYD